MSSGFFAKLALSNIKKNRNTYIPYIVTCIMTVAMFYIVKSLSLNPGLEEMLGGDELSYIMMLGSIIVGMFAFIFLFYTNSFLMKRRKKNLVFLIFLAWKNLIWQKHLLMKHFLLL